VAAVATAVAATVIAATVVVVATVVGLRKVSSSAKLAVNP